jgi:hypothetical protein
LNNYFELNYIFIDYPGYLRTHQIKQIILDQFLYSLNIFFLTRKNINNDWILFSYIKIFYLINNIALAKSQKSNSTLKYSHNIITSIKKYNILY